MSSNRGDNLVGAGLYRAERITPPLVKAISP